MGIRDRIRYSMKSSHEIGNDSQGFAADGTSAVFVGSSTSPSVLLSLDGSVTAITRPTRFSESLAPIHEAVRIEDPAGMHNTISAPVTPLLTVLLNG